MEINKTEALQRLEAIEKEAAELRKIIDKPQLPTFDKIAKELRPEWSLSIEGDICRTRFGGVYPYLHTSEASAERAKLRLEWELICEWVNKGKVIDWSNSDEKKWTFCYNHRNNNIECVHGAQLQSENRIYFTSESDARKALEIMGEDNWEKMNGII